MIYVKDPYLTGRNGRKGFTKAFHYRRNWRLRGTTDTGKDTAMDLLSWRNIYLGNLAESDAPYL